MKMNYKDATPSETIEKAKNILDALGLTVCEYLYTHTDVSYSCRISISNEQLKELNLGTNGKGMTPDYALASGYAELLERLQNNMLINVGMRYAGLLAGENPLDFRFYPDETIRNLEWSQFIDLIKELFPRIIPQTSSEITFDGIIVSLYVAPYADLTHGELRDVPISISRIPGSTGMCAGNSPSEAIMQGLCEVYERYVLQQLFEFPFSPPRFPAEKFTNTIVGDRLTSLKNEGFEYEICDLSLGGQFPVIGVILTNSEGRKMLRLGSDLDMEIALQRCITETFQGDNNAVEMSFIDYAKSYDNEISESFDLRSHFFRCLHNGSGRYPNIVINGTPKQKHSQWQWCRSGNSTNDLLKEIDRLKRNGKTILVRDNSFLGFCTYHVIVPGLSELPSTLSHSLDKYLNSLVCNDEGVGMENNDKIWPLYNPSELINDGNLNDVIAYLEEHKSQGPNTRLTPWNISPANSTNRNLLCFMLYHKCGDWKSSAFYMEQFIREREIAGFKDNDYFRCIVDVLKNMADHKISARNPDSGTYTSGFWSQELLKQVSEDLSGNVMRNFRFPTCFECGKCPIVKDCRFKTLIKIERLLQNKHKEAALKQTTLKNLFYTQEKK